MTDRVPGPALAAYHAGVTVICELAAQFTAEAWAAPTTCPEWHAAHALPVWDLPHHRYGDTVVTVAGMVGAACAEWHLHAWDLAASLGKDYRPASPELLAAGWQAGVPHLPLDTVVPVGSGAAAV